ncbi:MAG: hypothetical protein M3Y80_07685 [Verrucomicrobiota bacterium]|nr:hypothetical protein [Verrucomicrobiota bacterium]
MRINRAPHVAWAIFILLASAAATVLYVANWHPQRVPPGLRFFGENAPEHATVGGTPLGLIFGSISLAIFVFAALLGLRKRLRFLPIGHVQRWLRAHIWLTLLTVPLVLLHSGFHFGGLMTTLLMVLYAIVMVSGVYGLLLQQRMPTFMKERLPAEIVYEQIPNVRAQLCASAERLLKAYRRPGDVPPLGAAAPTSMSAAELPDVSEHAVFKTPSAMEKPMGGATIRGTAVAPAVITEAEPSAAVVDPVSEATLGDFLERQLLPYLRARRGDRFRLGKARHAEETFRYLQLRVEPAYRQRVQEMQGWCDERRLLDLQTKMQHWLHGWLFVHVPLSFLLLIWTGWHAFVTLFHY